MELILRTPNLIDPLSQIWDRLWVGTLWAALDLEPQNPAGIRAILNCTSEWMSKPEPFEVTSLHLEDGAPVPHTTVKYAVNWIHEMIKSGPVLICCHAGLSRSPGIAAAYLTRCGLSWDQAERVLRYRRPQIQIHPEISLSLRQALGQAPTAQDSPFNSEFINKEF